MNNAKRVLTFALAVCSLSAFASCGSSSDSSSKVVDKKLKEDQQQIVQRLADDMKDVRDLKSNEIKWFSHWDINPTEAEDKEIGADLALFKTKYNGKINWVQTTWETKFDDLAALVMSNDSPDFIGADDMDVFPKGAIKSMIEPIDDYIDLSKPLWTDIKGATDQFMLGDKHYVSVIRTDPAYVFVYNKQTMEDNGYDDPAELFKEGKWNWDTFSDMLQTFIESDPDKNVGLDGWWSELALYRSGGEAFIEAEDGNIIVNMNSEKIERAMNNMLNLYNKGLVMDKSLYDWNEQPQFMGEGRELFYITGSWAVRNPPEFWSTNIPAENLGMAPVPNSADAEHPWQAAVLDGFCMTKGAQNPLGVALYVECGLAAVDEGAREVNDKQCREEFKWPQDVIDHLYEINDLARQYPVVDLAGGMSTEIESLTTSNANKSVGLNAALHGVEWATTREELSGALDVLVAEVVDGLEKAQNE